MNCSKWGPGAWTYLHTITFNYPVNKPTNKDKNNMKHFFKSVGDTLPCKYCRASYKVFAKELPIENYLNSRKNLTKWLYLIHNKVNKKLKDQDLLHKSDPSFGSISRHYETFRAKCSNNTCRTKIKKVKST